MTSSSSKSVVLAEHLPVCEVQLRPRVSHVLEHVAGPWSADLAEIFPFPHSQLLNRSSVWLHIAAMVLANPIASRNNINVIFNHVRDWRDAVSMVMPTFSRETASIAKKLSLPLWPRTAYRQLTVLLEDQDAVKMLRHASSVTPEFAGMIFHLPQVLRSQHVIELLHHEDEAQLLDKLFGYIEADHLDRLVVSLNASPCRRSFWNKVRRAFIIAVGEFPSPPVINDDRFTPIQNAEQLYRAANDFRNCLRNYREEVLQGSAAFYVCNVDERAVVQVEPRFGNYAVTNICGIANEPVSDQTKSVILQVLADHGFTDQTGFRTHWAITVQSRLSNLVHEESDTESRREAMVEILNALKNTSG